MADEDYGYSGLYPFQTVPGLLSPEMNNNLQTRTMLGAAGGLLSAGGWSKTPVNIWEALSRGVQGGLGEYTSGMNDGMKQQLLSQQIRKMQQDAEMRQRFAQIFGVSMPGGGGPGTPAGGAPNDANNMRGIAPGAPNVAIPSPDIPLPPPDPRTAAATPGDTAAPPSAPSGLLNPAPMASQPPVPMPPSGPGLIAPTVRQQRGSDGGLSSVVKDMPASTRQLIGAQFALGDHAKAMETLSAWIGAKDKPSDQTMHFINPDSNDVVSYRANDPRADAAINKGWKMVSMASMAEKKPDNYMLPSGQNVLSSDGRSYIGTDGKTYQLPQDSVKLGADTAYDNVQAARIAKRAASANSSLPASEDRPSLESVAKAATGPYNTWQAGVNAVAGGLGADKLLGQDGLFRDTVANRNYLRLVQQTGKASLVNNPRFPEKEQATVDSLFPNPDAWITNPRTEADKVPLLRDRLTMQLRLNNEELQQAGIDKQRRDKLLSNNIETQRTLELLGPGSSSANDTLRGNEEPAKPAPKVDVTQRPIWQQMKAGDVGISKGHRYRKEQDGSATDLGPAR